MSKQATPNPEARVGAVSAGNDSRADHPELPKLSLLDVHSLTREDSRDKGDAIADGDNVANTAGAYFAIKSFDLLQKRIS